MGTKRFKELKGLSKDEMSAKVRESEAELFKVRIQKATGQLANTSAIWKLRKDIARLKMLLGQKSQ